MRGRISTYIDPTQKKKMTKLYIRMEEKRQYDLYDTLNSVFEDSVRDALAYEATTLPESTLHTLYPSEWLTK
jgi:hypothetical protein